MPSSVATAIWTSGARDRDAADRQEVAEREVDADPEHQQDDPDLGELGGDLRDRP